MNNLGAELERRISARLGKIGPQDPSIREALLRIGFLVESQTKRNIRSQRLIRTSNLINSIRSRLIKDGVVIGSFGVPYAAVHEFGFSGNVVVSGHTRTSRLGKPHSVASHSRFMNVRKRPYLRPALREKAPRIVEIIRQAFRGAK